MKCKYCQFEATGEVPRDQKSFCNENIKVPISERIRSEKFRGKVNGKAVASVWVNLWMSTEKKAPVISTFISDSDGNTILDKETVIKYCPVCGRKL